MFVLRRARRRLLKKEQFEDFAQLDQWLEQQLQQRLQRAVERELSQLSVAELLYDQRSWEASLDPLDALLGEEPRDAPS